MVTALLNTNAQSQSIYPPSLTSDSKRLVLFLCTGNYYRSRYAEILFNWKARQSGLAWTAISRGLTSNRLGPGIMSSSALAALDRLRIPCHHYLRFPIRVSEDNLREADHIVAVKEVEHRPMIARRFPRWLDQIEFWHVHDLDCCGPQETIALLNREVTGLVERMMDDRT